MIEQQRGRARKTRSVQKIVRTKKKKEPNQREESRIPRKAREGEREADRPSLSGEESPLPSAALGRPRPFHAEERRAAPGPTTIDGAALVPKWRTLPREKGDMADIPRRECT